MLRVSRSLTWQGMACAGSYELVSSAVRDCPIAHIVSLARVEASPWPRHLETAWGALSCLFLERASSLAPCLVGHVLLPNTGMQSR